MTNAELIKKYKNEVVRFCEWDKNRFYFENDKLYVYFIPDYRQEVYSDMKLKDIVAYYANIKSDKSLNDIDDSDFSVGLKSKGGEE